MTTRLVKWSCRTATNGACTSNDIDRLCESDRLTFARRPPESLQIEPNAPTRRSFVRRSRRACALTAAFLAACHTAPQTNLLASRDVLHAPMQMASPIIELRQYTLHPHRRDDLIDLFDANFVEPQEAVGMTIIGQFRNLDDPNKFVWLRGFPSMEARAGGLAEFYGGPAWKSRRNAANETIIDNDNVLLLRPVHPASAFVLDDTPRAAVNARQPGPGLVVATIYHIDPTDAKERDIIEFFEQTMTPLLAAAGAPVIATFIPERSANNFPGLPIREGEHVFVWFSRFPSAAAYARFQRTLGDMPRWRDSVAAELSSKVREPATLRLVPTARSRLHG